MNYPTYLVHFNPYHDPKTGQFTRATGDFKGVRISMSGRKRKNAIKEGVVTKEGYITKKAEDDIGTFLEYTNRINKTQSETKKLFDASESLFDDFGSPNSIDDWEFFEQMVERDPRLNISDFKKARMDEENFLLENHQRIQEGMKIINNYFPYSVYEILNEEQ